MKKNKGFTLIELLVVIAIIGVLSAVALVGVSGAQRQGRDAQRRSDLAQYRVALEGYYSSQTPNAYIASTLGVAGTVLSSLSPNYMSSLPADPKQTGACVFTGASPADRNYCYISDPTAGTATSYVLITRLEGGLCFYYCGTNNTTGSGKSGTVACTTAMTVAAYCP